jgi:hypothetical protein
MANQKRRVALAPDLQGLSERGVRAWTERMAVTPVGDAYVVDSESGATYVVDPVAGTCSCPDRQIRGETCKHLRRVAIEITTGRVPPPGARRVTCDACGTETVVHRERDPPDLCDVCALDPGDVVIDQEADDRLVVTRVTTDRADEVTIEDTTVADYPTNEGYPDDDLVVVASYLPNALERDEPTQYSFPRSRLRRTDTALVE